MNDGLVFSADNDVVMPAVAARLTRRGLSLVRSFDLRSALATHPECECPHHGTAQCSCQYVVFLVYGNAAEPIVLTIHSHDGMTWAGIVHDATTSPDPELAQAVMAGLCEAALTLETASIQDAGSEFP